ncbi:MAG: glycosyltransferase [Bacteroidia bacterium]|nr:glycosyltransferase [Bacteroidia bacterium]
MTMNEITDPAKRPLVTLYVLSYNRCGYIQKALESAFCQTYSPLEIVISDNGSTDGTYETIENTVRAYCGPHSVIVNRNTVNLGLIGNVKKAFSLAHGELLIMQCDDDISRPNRVERIVEEWVRYEKRPYVVCSSYTYMRTDGGIRKGQGFFWPLTGREKRSLDEVILHYSYRGSSAGYRPEVISAFEDISEVGCYDDMVLFVRGKMLGDILLIKDDLLFYREGGLSANTGNVATAFLKKAGAEKSSNLQIKKDVHCQFKKGLLSYNDYTRLLMLCDKVISDIDARVCLLSSNMKNRFSAYRHLAQNAEGQPKLLLLVMCVCPKYVTHALVWVFFKIKQLQGDVI